MTAIPVFDFKKGLSKYIREASSGLEVVAENKHEPRKVSLVNTEIFSAALDALHFSIIESFDYELGIYTLAIDEIPPYGEGKTKEEAIESLLDAIHDYCDAYLYRLEVYSVLDTPTQRALMLKLIRCGEDRKAILHALRM